MDMRAPTRGNFRHGETTETTKSPEYVVWSSMRDRCNNPRNQRFARYGGRGISVCERWNDFANFLEDMGRRPTLNHTIERMNNDGSYEPGNCRWATRAEQNENQSTTRKVTAYGRTQSVSAWAREIGVSRESLRDRLNRGMSPEEAVSVRPIGHGYKERTND